MKHPFTIYDLRFTIWKKSAESAVATRHSPPVTRHSCRSLQPSAFSLQPSQNGVALIITLILLSVVTVMAITFLALSSRERGAVTTVTDTAGARLAADAALANAEAQIVANVLSTTNPYNFGLLVSTNYINPLGFQTAPLATYTSFSNVNYFTSNGIAISGDDFLQNLANLYYSPRPPVFIPTNAAGGNDFRFYLDLNRNGRDDPNGKVPNVEIVGGLVVTNGTISEVGDPEWIGVLERPDAPYGPNNKFIARYAFIAVPVGNTLDLNAIHNQAHAFPSPPSPPPGSPGVEGVNPSLSGYNDNFVRNEGVGSWEINLAAFLADLNTNEWGQYIGLPGKYYWYQDLGFPPPYENQGSAFDDARALLAYRYNNDFRSLASVNNLFSPAGVAIFTSDNIDGYTYDFPPMTGFQLPGERDSNLKSIPWVGADNTNHFFSHQELFDSTKIQNPYALIYGFTDHLLQAGTNVSTYDRYTFYRLLSQLGTDTTPDAGKMNLNYDNLNPYILTGNGPVLSTNGIAASTNFVAWQPLGFFTNAADRLLRAYTTQWRNSNPTNFATTFYSVTDFTNIIASQWTTNYLAFGITNIPVLIGNQFVYSSAVNRLLQLAANMYDATSPNFYPSVFRPTFWVTNEFGYINVYINGYQQVFSASGTNDYLSLPVDVTSLKLGASVNNYSLPMGVNVYGVPWIIGAKKGFPNFNEFSMESIVQTTRKLSVTRTVNNLPPQAPQYQTNQMYIFSINNSIGVECLNSYTNSYSNTVQIVLYDNLWMTLTNNGTINGSQAISSNYVISVSTNVTPWQGSIWGYNALDSSYPSPFIIPLQTNVVFMPDSVYSFFHQWFTPENPNFPPGWETNNLAVLPHFGLATSNQFQLFMLDGNGPPYHVIDYVQFAGPNSLRDLNAELANPDLYDPNGMWQTNLVGVQNQLNLSAGTMVPNSVPPEDGYQWVRPPVPGITIPSQSQAYFLGLFQTNNVGQPLLPWTDGTSAIETNLSYGTQAPFTPTRTVVQYISWQANDPLVHYVASDLNYSGTEQPYGGPSTGITNYDNRAVPMLRDLGKVNDRYQPWGMTSQMTELANVNANAFDLAFKDPLVRMPDNWDFPTYKLPGIGWLGRVHRGTPWQSVYLKASDVLAESNGTNTWAQWTGDTQLTYSQYFDAANGAPVQDRLLFDLFTTAFNDNATRGTLSVNQPNLAAWSALFSGLVVLSNNAPDNVRMSQVAQYQNPPPSNSWMIIQPAGPWTILTNSALGRLVNGINQTRTNTSLFPLQSFAHVGDILAAPQFTERSPFLHWNDAVQQQNGISDEMYEWLPQQTMSLLRCASSPRYVIYCYGQTLKPVLNASYMGSGPFFGMITNYQVVSEIATRAVVRFNSALTNIITTNTLIVSTNGLNWFSVPVVTNNNAVIENFNILPPD
jgi:hypothetical protein